MRVRLLILSAFALVPLLVWGASPVVSDGASQRELDKVERAIRAKERKIGAKRGTERVLTTDISRYTSRIRELQGRISRLQSRQQELQADLDAKRAELVRVQDQLRDERARLTRLKRRLVVSRKALATRLVELYKADSPDLITVVLESQSFADLLERGEFLRRISEHDTQVVARVRVAKADAEATTKRLAALEARKQKVAAAILMRRNEVQSVKDELVAARAGWERNRAGKQRILSRVRAQRHHLEDDLGELRERQAEIQAELSRIAGDPGTVGSLPAGPIRSGSGGMIWPVNGPLTSPWCESRSWESCHPGIDIGVPSGTPIRAAASGKVVLMQPESASGGYGNFTCIQHTSSMSTCYAHQSRFGTSMGASVTQGQVIGYVGSTGHSTGPHLHFEVRVNGSVTNPMSYL